MSSRSDIFFFGQTTVAECFDFGLASINLPSSLGPKVQITRAWHAPGEVKKAKLMGIGKLRPREQNPQTTTEDIHKIIIIVIQQLRNREIPSP